MATETTELQIKVTADAKGAVSGLAPINAGLTELAANAEKSSSALDGLAGEHKINVDDAELKLVRDEIARLQTQLREQLRVTPEMNTGPMIRQINGLRRTESELQKGINIPLHVQNVDKVTEGEHAISQLGRVAANSFPALNNFGYALTSIDKPSPAVVAGIGALGAAFGAWKLTKLAADAQTVQLQLKALTGSSQAAAQTFQELNKFAADTPFTFDQVTAAAKNLLVAGDKPSQLPQTLTDLGNIASTVGAPLEQISFVFEQMHTSGRIANQDLLQLAQAGIPVYDTLAKQLGTTAGNVQKLASQSKIGADQIEPLIHNLGQLFPGAMVEQAHTFNGEMSTLGDTLKQMGVSAGQDLLPEMQGLVTALQDLLNIAGKVPGPVKAIALAFGGAYAAQKLFGSTVSKGVGSLKEWTTGIKNAEGGGGKFKAGLSGLASAFNPWTLAITGGVALLSIWAAKQAAAKKKVDELSAGIDGQTGKLNENGKAILANQISGWGDDAAKAGVGMDDLTKSLLGGNDAFEQQIEVLKGVVDAHTTFHNIAGRGGVSSTANVMDDTGQAAQNLITDMESERSTMDKATQAAKDHATAQEAVKVATGDASSSMTQLNTSVKDTAKAYQTALTNFSAFNDAVSGNIGTIYAYDGALDDLRTSLAKGGTFAPTEKQGRANWDALVKVGQSASDRIATVLKTRGTAAANAVYQNSRDTLHTMLTNAGVQSNRAWGLVNDVLKKPHTMHVELSKIDTANVTADLARLNKKKAKIQASFDLPTGDLVNQRIAGTLAAAGKRLKPIDAKINADVQKLNPAKKNLDDAAKPRTAKISPKIDPSSYAAAKGSLDTLTAPATKIIKVHMQENPTGDTIDPNTFFKNTTGALTMHLASPAGAATATASPSNVMLAPRTTPVKVYLDGQEIASHLDLQAARLSTPGVRRA